MKKSTLISALVVLLLAGCVGKRDYRSGSPDEMARQLSSQVPDAPERTVKRVSTSLAEQLWPPFQVYTWQPRDREDGAREIVVLGKNLMQARSLMIGDIVVKLTPKEGGRSAAGPYPSDAPRDKPILLTVGEHMAMLPERFSPLKPEGLPRIRSCSFSWETVRAPERIPRVGGRSVRTIRFDCVVDGFEARNAPVTAFIGPVTVPNSQIVVSQNGLTGYVYRISQLEQRAPMTIDFGHGLRVLAPVPFMLP